MIKLYQDLKNKNIALILISILILVVLFLNMPNFISPSIPAGQTDMAHFYGISKYIADGGNLINELPDYAHLDEIPTAKDYPVLFTLFFALLSKLFNDVLLLNGLFISIFVVISLIYLFLFVKLLSKNNYVAIFSVLFYGLNLRLYYFAIAGVWPFLIASLLSVPSLYFCYKCLKNLKLNNSILFLLFNFLVFHAHQMMGVFLIVIELFFCLGFYLKKMNFRIKFPKIDFEIKYKKINLKSFFILSFSVLILFFFNAIMFTLTNGRKSWLGSWFASMFASYQGFQVIWWYFLLFDGPIIAILGFIAGIYFLYKNYWIKFSLWFSGLIIILLPYLVLGHNKISTYCYKFYVFWAIILSFSAVYLLFSIRKKLLNKKVIDVIIILILLIHLVQIGVFSTQIRPAITEFHLDKIHEINNLKDQNVLFINNMSTTTSFLEFKWIPIFLEADNFKMIYLQNYLNNSSDKYDKIFLVNDVSLKQLN